MVLWECFAQVYIFAMNNVYLDANELVAFDTSKGLKLAQLPATCRNVKMVTSWRNGILACNQSLLFQISSDNGTHNCNVTQSSLSIVSVHECSTNTYVICKATSIWEANANVLNNCAFSDVCFVY